MAGDTYFQAKWIKQDVEASTAAEGLPTYAICVEHGRVNQDIDTFDLVRRKREAAKKVGGQVWDGYGEWAACRNQSAAKVLAFEAQLKPVFCPTIL